MSALDADVIKTYVELGLGMGIIAPIAYDTQRDAGLVLLQAPDEIPPSTTLIAVRRGHCLRGFAYRFIDLCSERLGEAVVRAALAPRPEETAFE